LRRRPDQDDATRAFEDILDRYEKRVFNLARRLMGDHDEASDVTQETFVRAYKAIRRFRQDSDPFTWLSKITVNTCRNRFRQRDRRRRFEGAPFSEDVAAQAAEGSPRLQPSGSYEAAQTPHKSLEQRELGEKISESLQSLTDEHREAVVLRDFEGLSYQEIAEVTGATIENVKTRIFRGRSAMRERLLPYLKGQEL
jgi:RNA polymerase sigma-70 factor (ECF subfamily)